MDKDEIILTAEEKWEKTVNHFGESIKAIRTGRATTSLIEQVRVDYYGAPTPLQQLANITAPEARLLVVKPYDAGALKEIEKALGKADLGAMPVNDGKLIRLSFPPLSEETRKKLGGKVKEQAEHDKIALRNARRDVMHMVDESEKKGALPEDAAERLREELQVTFKGYEAKIDELVAKKTKEIMEV